LVEFEFIDDCVLALQKVYQVGHGVVFPIEIFVRAFLKSSQNTIDDVVLENARALRAR